VNYKVAQELIDRYDSPEAWMELTLHFRRILKQEQTCSAIAAVHNFNLISLFAQNAETRSRDPLRPHRQLIEADSTVIYVRLAFFGSSLVRCGLFRQVYLWSSAGRLA